MSTQKLNPPPNVIWKPSKPQTWLITCPISDILYGGARGGGKTDGLLGDFAAHSAANGEHAKGILFRKSTPELDEVIFRSKQIYLQIGAIYRESKKTWIFPNGSTLKLRFIENDRDADKYQGHSYTWMGFDEAGNWKSPDPLDKLRSTLRNPHGIRCKLIHTANPGGIGHQWIKRRYIDPAPPLTPFYDEERNTWRVYIPSLLSDNEYLSKNDPTYIDRIKSSGPSWLVRAWLEGDWEARDEGSIFKRDQFQYFNEQPIFDRIVQSWDTAYKTGAENDFSVCVTVGVAKNGFYIIDRWKGKVEFPELKRVSGQLADKFRPTKIYIEDKSSGQSLIQELRKNTLLPLFPVRVESDKIARAYSVTPIIEAGRVFLPNNAPWIHDFLETLTTFPKSEHDDDVDAFTQVLIEEWLRKPRDLARVPIDFMGR